MDCRMFGTSQSVVPVPLLRCLCSTSAPQQWPVWKPRGILPCGNHLHIHRGYCTPLSALNAPLKCKLQLNHLSLMTHILAGHGSYHPMQIPMLVIGHVTAASLMYCRSSVLQPLFTPRLAGQETCRSQTARQMGGADRCPMPAPAPAVHDPFAHRSDLLCPIPHTPW